MMAKRPAITNGSTYRIKTYPNKSYVTVNRHPETGEMIEVFINVGKAGSSVKSSCDSLCKQISRNLQSGTPAKTLAEDLRGTKNDEQPGHDPYWGEELIWSVEDAIARVMLKDIELKEAK